MLHRNALEIRQRENEGIVILDLSGKLEIGSGDSALRESVDSQLSGGNRRLILNMDQVSAIDTAGSGELLLLARKYQAAGGRVVLFGLNPAHAKIYEMARLETVVEIYPSELDAVNSFFPDRAVQHYDILEYLEENPHEEHDHEK